jgi:hypothetical protein
VPYGDLGALDVIVLGEGERGSRRKGRKVVLHHDSTDKMGRLVRISAQFGPVRSSEILERHGSEEENRKE